MAQFMEYLGEYLAGLCWTCRTPVKQDREPSQECDKCHACILMNEIRVKQQQN